MSLAGASMSMLFLQTSMLNTFGTKETDDMCRYLNLFTGTAVIVFVMIVAVYMMIMVLLVVAVATMVAEELEMLLVEEEDLPSSLDTLDAMLLKELMIEHHLIKPIISQEKFF